ncbi:hypothetical protein [Limimaricola cinnabarinus]|uniref:hypothetical protein n=1 Tax=Limimaricola cinnabarinus TaxID=1125964 RepID=UPI002FE19238
MALIEAIAAALAALGVGMSCLILRGVWTGHRSRGGLSATYRLSAGVFLVVSAYVARSLYWEFAPLAAAGAWSDWFAITGTAINAVFSAIFLRGLYHLLVLLWLLIPLEERPDWSLLEAPWYPDRAAFARAVQALRLRWRSPSKGDDDE